MRLWQLALLASPLGTLCAEEVAPSYAEYYDDGDPYGLELKRPKVEKDTPTKRHAKMGAADVIVEVKNIERLSEFEQWSDLPQSKKPEKKKSSGFCDDKEESDNPEASISIKWKIGH